MHKEWAAHFKEPLKGIFLSMIENQNELFKFLEKEKSQYFCMLHILKYVRLLRLFYPLKRWRDSHMPLVTYIKEANIAVDVRGPGHLQLYS